MLGACATAEAPVRLGYANASHVSPGYLPRDMRPAEAAALAALGRDDIVGVTFAAAQSGRAAIGAAAPAETAAHEGALGDNEGAVHAGKFANAAGSPLASLIQNGLPGGWRQIDGAVLHGPSGMRCPFLLNMSMTRPDGSAEEVRTALMNIRLYDQAGMDTSCDYVDANADVHVTLYASYWPDAPVEDHFAAALKLIVDRFPVKAEAPLLVATPAMEGKGYALSTEPGETLAAAFITEPIDGDTYKTALWLKETGGWHVKARATFPVVVKDGEAALSVVEMVTATMHAATYRDVEAQAGAAQAVAYGKR